jgi:hypothetical protein
VETEKKVTSGEGHPSYTVGENHLDTDGHMFPSTEVIASPHRAETLGSSIERTCQDEGTLRRVRASFEGLPCQIGLKEEVKGKVQEIL